MGTDHRARLAQWDSFKLIPAQAPEGFTLVKADESEKAPGSVVAEGQRALRTSFSWGDVSGGLGRRA